MCLVDFKCLGQHKPAKLGMNMSLVYTPVRLFLFLDLNSLGGRQGTQVLWGGLGRKYLLACCFFPRTNLAKIATKRTRT